jgi:hypothetical protein
MGNTLIWTLLVSGAVAGSPAFAQEMSGHQMQMPPAQQTTPSTSTPPTPDDHGAMDRSMPMAHGAMDQSTSGDETMSHDMTDMTGAYGMYPMAREASGTSWQPDASMHMGEMSMHGNWMVMTHAMLNGVYDWQGGDRGDEKAFVSGMLMGMARRDLPSGDSIQLRAMLSPDPLMGARGYPLLLASGETANGVTPLIDRQHPHDLFMELSASYAHNLSEHDSVFIYGGLPGEPAFGPPAFMHRQSAMDDPQAPITHHWLDSTHITFGVLTTGWAHDNWKLEVSRFNGREPDQHRYSIESPQLDSTAVRVSWNPTTNLSLQASWADQKSPEQLEPGVDEHRWSASAIYTRSIGEMGWWSTTLAYGVRAPSTGGSEAGIALETAYHPNQAWTFFARAEQIETRELLPAAGEQTVQEASIGAIRDFQIAPRVIFGVGALYSHDFVPGALDGSYGDHPEGAMGFVRLKFNG